jgi:hypothetical protein
VNDEEELAIKFPRAKPGEAIMVGLAKTKPCGRGGTVVLGNVPLM